MVLLALKEKELRKENQLLAELHIAKELGLTLTQLREGMTMEEIWLWMTYFALQNEEQEAAMKKAKGRR